MVATDARRREVYWARYSPSAYGSGAKGVTAQRRAAAARHRTAADLYADQLQAVPGPRSMDPGVLATTGATLRRWPRPLYLRHPDATELTRPEVGAALPGATR